MELGSWPRSARAAHYQQQANNMRHLADKEPDEVMRERPLEMADQYQDLASTLAQRDVGKGV